jgi:glutamate/tyrosine decarboxylase-like PLP-dependent enzyme
MHGSDLRSTLASMAAEDRERLFAIVATCGTTNAGVIDDLSGAADAAAAASTWLHVDGAYGGAGLAAPSVRGKYDGIERADSFIVDPHKWLFAPFDCCALLYRDPEVAKAAHTQHAEYLDVLHPDPAPGGARDWNPSDYAHHLSRRARGLPFWFSLATYGTDAYRDAIETTLDVARSAARLIEAAEHLQLLIQPELSVLLFRRSSWTPAQYQLWSEQMLAKEESFVVPSSWNGETVLRLCIVNPLTTAEDIALIIDSLA